MAVDIISNTCFCGFKLLFWATMRREVKDCFQLTSADETVCRPVVTSETRRTGLPYSTSFLNVCLFPVVMFQI